MTEIPKEDKEMLRKRNIKKSQLFKLCKMEKKRES